MLFLCLPFKTFNSVVQGKKSVTIMIYIVQVIFLIIDYSDECYVFISILDSLSVM